MSSASVLERRSTTMCVVCRNPVYRPGRLNMLRPQPGEALHAHIPSPSHARKVRPKPQIRGKL